MESDTDFAKGKELSGEKKKRVTDVEKSDRTTEESGFV